MSRDDDSQTEWYPFYGPRSEPKATRKPKPPRKPSQRLPQPLAAPNESERSTDRARRTKSFILTTLIEERDITLEELETRIRDLGVTVSSVTVSNIRRQTRETLRTLDRMGLLRSTPRHR